MGDSPKPPVDASWDDLDQAFFASAPPDVPQPAPEPERFDDLFPAAPVEEKREAPMALRRAAAAATATRASVRRAWVNVGGRVRPAMAAAGRRATWLAATAWRRSTQTLRTARPAAGRLLSALRIPRLNGQAIALAFASVLLISGISAVVVASRNGGAHASLPARPSLERRAASNDGTLVASAAPAAPLPFAADHEQPLQSLLRDTGPAAQPPPTDPEPPHPQAPNEPRTRRAEVTKRVAAPAPAPAPAPAHKHRRAGVYSADKDLIVPSFMQPGPQPQAAPRPPAPAPFFARPAPAPAPAPYARPQPRPAQARPLFSR